MQFLSLAAVDWPHLAVLWTIRVCLLFYALCLAALISGKIPERVIRGYWTYAWLFYILHVLAAFQFVHHWDHAHAVTHTAEQTAQVVGIRFGGGIYFNHLLTLLWTVDVGWWWIREESHQNRAAWINYALHSYIFFLALNGSVIFEAGITRRIGIAILLLLGLVWLDRRRTTPNPFSLKQKEE